MSRQSQLDHELRDLVTKYREHMTRHEYFLNTTGRKIKKLMDEAERLGMQPNVDLSMGRVSTLITLEK